MSRRIYHQAKLALGSDVTLVVVTNVQQVVVDEYLRDVWRRIFEFEQQFSRFLPDSELSQFNQRAGIRQNISPEFSAILRCAQSLSQEMDGLYNPFVLPLLQGIGYSGSFVGDYGHEPEIDFSSRSFTTAEKLRIGDDWAVIPYGTAVDLGGCGKGYLGDKLVSTGLPDWLDGFWFSFGGDVIGGGEDEAGRPWTVEIMDTLDPEQPAIGQFVSLGESFHIATSSIKERRGKKNGKDWHHIIDPRTKRSARTNVMNATVSADSLVMADVLATCSIILGSDQAPIFLESHGGKSALLGIDDGTGVPSYCSYGNEIQSYKTRKGAVV